MSEHLSFATTAGGQKGLLPAEVSRPVLVASTVVDATGTFFPLLEGS